LILLAFSSPGGSAKGSIATALLPLRSRFV
jgi:hypothetical protein